MLKCVVVAFVCVAAVHAHSPAAAASIPYSPQEQYLALANTGNFACKVNSLKVTIDNPGSPELAVVLPEHIRASFANVATLEWSHIAQTSFSAMDARNDEKVLSTAGGDMGEFVQALAAFSKVAGRVLTTDEVQKVFERYLKVMTRGKFSYETDEKAYMNIAVATGCRNLHVSEMGGMKHKKEAYVANLLDPAHIGDPFLKFLAANATEIGFDVQNLRNALIAYHNVLWTSPSKLSQKLCYLEMKGAHKPTALINVKTESFCVDQGLAPMVSPLLACPGPVLVNHPDAVRVFRRELVTVLTEGSSVDAASVMAELNLLTETYLSKFWSAIGEGLPVYTVEFQNSSPLLSTDVAYVPEE